MTLEVLVEDHGSEVSVTINGERDISHRTPGEVGLEYARKLIRARDLEAVIREHIRWLYSRTPEQVEQLDASRLRAMASELAELCDLDEGPPF